MDTSSSHSSADRIGVRELRNQVASVLRRAEGGDRIVVTVDGRPVAQLGPLDAPARFGIDDLIAAGLLDPPGMRERPDAPPPAMVPVDISIDSVLDEVRR